MGNVSLASKRRMSYLICQTYNAPGLGVGKYIYGQRWMVIEYCRDLSSISVNVTTHHISTSLVYRSRSCAFENMNSYFRIIACSWASWQIRKIAGCACAGNAGNVFPRRQLQMKPLVSDPSMHHGTCVTHVPWCMSGSLFRGGGENVPGIPGACATRNFTYLVRGPWGNFKEMCLSYLT